MKPTYNVLVRMWRVRKDGFLGFEWIDVLSLSLGPDDAQSWLCVVPGERGAPTLTTFCKADIDAAFWGVRRDERGTYEVAPEYAVTPPSKTRNRRG